jgi:hypothetical protein
MESAAHAWKIPESSGEPIITIREHLTPPPVDLRVALTRVLLLSALIFVVVFATTAITPHFPPPGDIYTFSLFIVAGGV